MRLTSKLLYLQKIEMQEKAFEKAFRPIRILISSSCSALFKLMWMLPVWNWTHLTGVQQSPKWPLQPEQCSVAITLTGRPDEREDQTWLSPPWWRTRTAFPSTAAHPSPARRTRPPGLAPGSDACSSSRSSGSLSECTTRRKFSANIGKRWRVTGWQQQRKLPVLEPQALYGHLSHSVYTQAIVNKMRKSQLTETK